MQQYKEAILYIIFMVIVFVFLVMRLQPQVVDLYATINDIKAKTVEASDLERKLETLKAAEAEKNTISGDVKTIYKPGEAGLDTESSFSVIFNDIVDMAKYNSVKLYSIEYVYNPPEDDFVKGAPTQYNVCQLKMQVIADYEDLQNFLKEIYKYPNLVNIEKLELIPYQKNKKILLSNLQLKLYSSK